MTITSRPIRGRPQPARRLDRAADPGLHATPSRGRSRPGPASPGPSAGSPVVGAGKMGLPLAAQFAGHGWDVIAVDVQASVVDAINAGRNHVAEEPGLAERVAAAHAAGRLRATPDGAAAAATADVVVLIVPVMLDDEQQPDYRYMDAAVEAIAPGRPRGLDDHLRDDPAGRRHARPVRAAPRGGQRAARRGGLLRRLLAGAPVQRRGAPEPRDLPQARRRARRRVGCPRGGLLRLGPRRRGRPDELRRGGRVQQARRHDLSRREHRPGQRVRPLRRAGRRRHPGSDRGRQQPAVQPHPPAGPRRRRPLHPGLSRTSCSAGRRRWSSSS